VLERLCTSAPRVVGVSIICHEQIQYAASITKQLKQANLRVVWGGPEITGWTDADLYSFQDEVGIDVIVRGDGEYALEQIINATELRQDIVQGTAIPLSKIGVGRVST
jgi:radical SAM superfamily enzyme YgiQ (UPF0313 family)